MEVGAPPAYLAGRPPPLATDDDDFLSPSSSPESRDGDAEHRQRSLKKAAEKKFRQRYLLLQQAYEQRLQALAAQVRHVVAELQSDTTIAYLQEDPLTQEYASARVSEVLHECFAGEKEKYVKIVSDQIAWQTSDLREAQARIRALEKKEKVVQSKWRHAQSEIRELQQQSALRERETDEHRREAARCTETIRKLEDERDEARLELERQRVALTSLESVRRDYDIFQMRVQNEREQDRAAREHTVEQVEKLRNDYQKLEAAKEGIERDNQQVRHLLAIAEAKNEELSNSLQQVQAQEYSTRLVKLEHELSQQRHANEMLQADNERLQKKYEEFGVQVELYMEEQTREQVAIKEKGEDREKKLLDELSTLRSQSVEAIKAKQGEIIRLADQIKFRQEAFTKAEQRILILEGKVSSTECALGEEKLHCAKMTSDLEKDVVRWRETAEKQQKLAKNAEATHEQMKQAYEQNLKSLRETLEHQHQQVLKERELEAQTRWQNDFVAKQEARIEALKNKYEAALEAQQAELVRSRQTAVDAARTAADKANETKSFQLLQRVNEEDVKRRREELREAERLRIETERVKETNRKLTNELEEKERRLRELEQKLTEKERLEERRRWMEEKKAKETKAAKPNVVVLNVQDSDELEQHEEHVGAQGISIAKRQRKSMTKRQQARGSEDNQESLIHEDCIPIAQHRAELQAREAQIALEAEKRLQKEMHDFQERKERELRNAMVNVRKGIQKLESSLDNERSDKKRIEEELFSERNAFVALKSEFDDNRDAKRALAQRLEEANSHLGRLRAIVKEAQQSVTMSTDRLDAAVFEKAEAEKLAAALRGEIEELKMSITELNGSQAKLEDELLESQREREELTTQMKKLEEDRELQDRQFREERHILEDANVKEVECISEEFSARVQMLEARLVEQQSATMQLQGRVEGDARSLEQLSAERLLFERTLQATKSDLANQRKEFNDLVRMHKNLNETMNAKIRDEQEKSTQLEAELITLRLSHRTTQLDWQKSLELCLARVRSLRTECNELRMATRAEVKFAWKQVKKDTLLHSKQIQAWIGETLEQEKQSRESALRIEREEWQTVISAKEKEMANYVADLKGDDKIKHSKLASELETKSKELRQLQQRSAVQLQRIDELLLMVKKLEDDNRTRDFERSQLVDQLSSSRVLTDREAEAKQHLEVSFSKVTDATRTLLDFVRRVMKEHALDSRRVLRVLENDSEHPETWNLDELSRDLRRVLELLQERMTAKEVAAADLAARPIQTELNAAREALAPLLDSNDNVDDAVLKHLPWYALIVRSVKHRIDDLQDQAQRIHQEIEAKRRESADLHSSLERLQHSHAAVVFEKDTQSHEMALQLQTLQKRRESDLQLAKDEHERKVEQLQRRLTSDQLKAKEEFDASLEELKLTLDAEKKANAKLKQDAMIGQIEHDKLLSELRDREAKIEKELESTRDELAKWKRKAKLSASKSPGTPSRRPSVMFSSPFHTTDDDTSDASLQFPVSRRPSSAMADLSNLMEQSLQDLRKDNEGFSAPIHQPSPARLLQSPMRRGSANTRPSPLRIPMYPSPARKRTSLVPPPKLISTVTGNSITTLSPMSE